MFGQGVPLQLWPSRFFFLHYCLAYEEMGAYSRQDQVQQAAVEVVALSAILSPSQPASHTDDVHANPLLAPLCILVHICLLPCRQGGLIGSLLVGRCRPINTSVTWSLGGLYSTIVAHLVARANHSFVDSAQLDDTLLQAQGKAA